jgi:hypothetical protein
MFIPACLLSCRFHLRCPEPHEVQLASNISLLDLKLHLSWLLRKGSKLDLIFLYMTKHFA